MHRRGLRRPTVPARPAGDGRCVGGRFGSARVPSDHPLPVGLARVAEAVTGRRRALLGEPYGADMRLLVNEGGTPTVIFGPGDVRVAHSADEHVPLAEVEACAGSSPRGRR